MSLDGAFYYFNMIDDVDRRCVSAVKDVENDDIVYSNNNGQKEKPDLFVPSEKYKTILDKENEVKE